jgi:hypothetical protein
MLARLSGTLELGLRFPDCQRLEKPAFSRRGQRLDARMSGSILPISAGRPTSS